MSDEKEPYHHAQAARASSFGPRAKLLAVAALLHVATTVGLLLAGRYKLLPAFVDENGVAGSFASDGRLYIAEVRLLLEELWTNGPAAWLAMPFAAHVKIYSLCFGAVSWCFGYTILSAEPLNLLCYLTILALVYWLGKECFDERAGLISAAVVALWPSFLLHTTQLLKEPLFIVAMLALVAASVRLLLRSHTLGRGLGLGLAGGAAVAAVRLMRDEASGVAVLLSLAVAGLVALRSLSEGNLPTGNVAGAALLVLLSFCAPLLIAPYRIPTLDSPMGRMFEAQPMSPDCRELLLAARTKIQSGSALPSLLNQVSQSRILATCVPGSGSNIDAEVVLHDVGDVVLYLPRAAIIGFLAPFPRLWFARGSQVGFAGRALSGAEMLATYLIELMALAGLWMGRKRPAVWLLAFVSAAGITALGIAMPNLGTLYRMRYVFWMLLVILAAGCASQIISVRMSRREQRLRVRTCPPEGAYDRR